MNNTVKLFIFATINFCVLPMEYQFAAMNFRIYVACLISYYGSIQFLQRLIFAKISTYSYRENKSLPKLKRFTVLKLGQKNIRVHSDLCLPNFKSPSPQSDISSVNSLTFTLCVVFVEISSHIYCQLSNRNIADKIHTSVCRTTLHATSFRSMFYVCHQAMNATIHYTNIILSFFSILCVLRCAAKTLKICSQIKM